MLVSLSSNIPVCDPNSHSFGNSLCNAAARYLYCGTLTATKLRSGSAGKYHFVNVQSHTSTTKSIIITALKIISYIALCPLPLLALLIKAVGRASHHYYYDDPKASLKQSVFLNAFEKNNLSEITKLYSIDHSIFDTQLHNNTYGTISPLLAAALNNQTDVMDFLLKTQGADILNILHQGDSPIVLACKNNKVESVKWFLKQGIDPTTADHQGTSLFFVACTQQTPDIAMALLEKDKTLLTKKDANNITPFEAAIAALSKGIDTTKTAKWLYDQGAGRGLFLNACTNKKDDLAKTLYRAIGDKILYETDSSGKTHLETACYRGQTKLVNAFLRASNKNAMLKAMQTISPKACKGGILGFLKDNQLI